MRAVVDEGVPRALVQLLNMEGCDVSPFPNDWKGTKNGMLLARLRESGFDALVTCDRSLQHQQNIEAAGVALIVLPGQRLEHLEPEIERIAGVLKNLSRGGVAIMLPAPRTS